MKKIITFLIYIMPLTLLAQDPSQCSGSYDNDNRPQGLWVCNYTGGQVWFEINYNAGNYHGVKKEYYENSQLKLEVNYSNGVLNGLAKEYHSGGQLKYEGSFTSDIPTGIHKEYNVDGTIKSENNFGN
ncbi:MAG: toxin-antitoxin system YwqK family antitoxin [Bacteroidota bacterium]